MSKLDIGLRQGKLLCQMKHAERLDFLAEGLPIILESARGFWKASQQLGELPREADVLENHAEEEAAKILILMDMVRCPRKLGASKMGDMVKWFYDHLARLIYANATSWKPMHVTQLREYVDNTRKAHFLDGPYGEYIVPNSEISNRESTLYADIEAYEDKKPMWSAPKGFARSFPSFTPPSLALAEAFSALGIFRAEGLRATAEIWDALEFKDTQNLQDLSRLTQSLVAFIIDTKLASEMAEQSHVDRIYNSWQFPMYNIDFSLRHVPLEQLQRERDAMFYAEAGYREDYY